jgi:TetR/AcrR family transcriptional regulator, transcriptional repressor for nem operon
MTAAATTQQGRATRERIVRTAAALIGEHGASGTSLDQVRAASGASQSQLYHYFGDKHGLVHAVVDHQATAVIASEREILGAVQDWDDLQRWAAAIVTGIEKRHARGGCPIGTLAAALADTDEAARQRLELAFADWGEAIGMALTRLRDNGLLPPDADLPALTTATLASLQGGLLLAKTAHDSAPLRIALHAAISYLKHLAVG